MRFRILDIVLAITLFNAGLGAPLAADLSGVAAGTAPQDTPWSVQWERFGRSAKEAGFDLDLLVHGELGSEETILSALRRNRVQIGGFTSAALVSAVPETAILLAPYVFSSVEQQDYVLDRHLGPELETAFRSAGLVWLQWIDSGWGAIFAVKPIRIPKDLKGLRLRISPNFAHQAVMESLNVDSAPMGLAEFIPGLQSGLVDGGVSVAVFYEAVAKSYAPFFTMTGHYRETGAMVANAEWFDALPANKQIVLRLAFGQPEVVRSEVRKMETKLIKSMSENGVTVIHPGPSELALWQAATAPAKDIIFSNLGPGGDGAVKSLCRGLLEFTDHEQKQLN